METLRISMLGTSRAPLEALLAEAATCYSASQSCRTAVYSCDAEGYWSSIGSRPIRPLGTVILPDGQVRAAGVCARLQGSTRRSAVVVTSKPPCVACCRRLTCCSQTAGSSWTAR
jgi:hypothetical protein